MAVYYWLDTGGENTNLQLFSLKQAKKYWEEIQADYENYGEFIPELKERSVFVLASLGLSISQLLGQVNPNLSERVPSPGKIFNDFVDTNNIDPSLKKQFEEFVFYYDGCRHFGKTSGNISYKKIDQLTFQKAKECYEFGLKIWKIVIDVFRSEPSNELDELDLDNLGAGYG